MKTYLSIAQPEWYVPMHGEFRHLVANAELGDDDGRAPRPGARVRGRRRARASPTAGVEVAGRVPAGYLYVDGIVGDVGIGRAARPPGARLARAWSWSSSPSTSQTGKVLVGPEIITRGWVYAPEAEDLLDEACDTIAAAVEAALADGRARRRGARARRAPGRRQVRQRAHPPPADDRARRDGGVTAGRARVVCAVARRGAARCWPRRARVATTTTAVPPCPRSTRSHRRSPPSRPSSAAPSSTSRSTPPPAGRQRCSWPTDGDDDDGDAVRVRRRRAGVDRPAAAGRGRRRSRRPRR